MSFKKTLPSSLSQYSLQRAHFVKTPFEDTSVAQKAPFELEAHPLYNLWPFLKGNLQSFGGPLLS